MDHSAWEDAKRQVKQLADIVSVIGASIRLERRGRVFLGLCPFHDDSRPSMNVDPERQWWKCWVCNVGGDVFDFVMKQERVEFREALQILAERVNVELPKGQVSPASKQAAERSRDARRRALAANGWASETYQTYLVEAQDAGPARRYLAKRGFREETLESFRVGFAPPEWSWLAGRVRPTEIETEDLELAGLLGQSDNGRKYDVFRGRVLFPIRDAHKQVVGFGGRILPEHADERSAKYVNTRETPAFSKREHLFGLDLAKETILRRRQALVMEGYTDVMMAHQVGVRHAVAVLGTALGESHLKMLRALADSVILVLDGDEAGRRRASETLDLFLAADVDLRIVTLPEDLDPCDFLAREGGEAFLKICDEALDALSHKLRIATDGIDLLRDTHRAAEALDDVLRSLARVPVAKNAGAARNPLRVPQMIARLSREFSIDDASIRRRLDELRREVSRTATRGGDALPVESGATPAKPFVQLARDERELLELLIARPELLYRVRERISHDRMPTETGAAILDAMIELENLGETIELRSLLDMTEDPSLRSAIVALDESARGEVPLAVSARGVTSGTKISLALDDALSMIDRTLDAILSVEKERAERIKQQQLETGVGDDEEMMRILLSVVNDSRRRAAPQHFEEG
ncbi:MAG TPA: DNA primase [Pirellulaceae bacterium]|jgi:DNA primase|nr:DNA primase [Pirellulaceae bacterium]